jgi:SET domain-containing protein
MGGMVNDAPVGSSMNNCKMKLIFTERPAQGPGLPRLCLFSTRDIKSGEELRYDYGVDNLPWRNKVKLNFLSKFLEQNLVFKTIYTLNSLT